MEKGNFLITSDQHFGHENILTFERGAKFKTIQEHDEYLENMLEHGLRRMKGGDTFYTLGDWGELNQSLFDKLKKACEASDCRKVALLGNHDKQPQINQLLSLGFEVYDYPIFIDKRVVLSHYPYLQVNPSVCNIFGHLHGSTLDVKNGLCASVAVHNYSFISKQEVQNLLSQLDKWDMRFLYEYYADKYIFNSERSDILMDKNRRIDLSASRLLQILRAK